MDIFPSRWTHRVFSRRARWAARAAGPRPRVARPTSCDDRTLCTVLRFCLSPPCPSRVRRSDVCVSSFMISRYGFGIILGGGPRPPGPNASEILGHRLIPYTGFFYTARGGVQRSRSPRLAAQARPSRDHQHRSPTWVRCPAPSRPLSVRAAVQAPALAPCAMPTSLSSTLRQSDSIGTWARCSDGCELSVAVRSRRGGAGWMARADSWKRAALSVPRNKPCGARRRSHATLLKRGRGTACKAGPVVGVPGE
jgi:hypothetical protein